MEIIEKPWGHEKIISKTSSYVVKELYLKPNSKLSLQYHNVKTETMILVEGEGFLQFDEIDQTDHQMVKMVPWHIPRKLIHRLYTKNQSCLVVEVSSTELDDVIRIEDDYGRI